MKNLILWRRALVDHPGVLPAVIMQIMGFVAGLARSAPPTGWQGGLYGLAICSLFWLPVLITAWLARNQYDRQD